MITTAILTLIRTPLFWLINYLPATDVTAFNTIQTLINNWFIPSISFMKVWLPMDTFYFWVKLTITLHISVILFKLTGKIIYMLSGGLIKLNHLS